jgi:hypothetical protein
MAEIDTVTCDECDRYYLTSDLVIHDGKEVLNCDCGCTSIINELDDLKLVLADDELLEHKLKSACKAANGDPNLMAIAGAALAIMQSVASDMFEKETILLMLEKKGILAVAEMIYQKTKVAEQTAEKVKEALLRAEIEAKVKKEIKQPIPQQSKSAIQGLLEETSIRYQKNGSDALSGCEVNQFMQDYDDCILPHKERAVRTRLTTIESEGKPLHFIKSFIRYIEGQIG